LTYLGRIRDALLGRSRDNADHVSLWWPSGIAETAERNGLRLDCYRGVSTSKARTCLGKLVLWLGPLLARLPAGPDALCSSVVYECVKP
jgi:hypothetical protein